MDWRTRFLRRFGPGILGGITFGDWVKLLRRQDLSIDPSRFHRAAAITIHSLKNSAIGLYERTRYEAALKNVVVPPPVFVLGHWRSGTTHLHQLLAQDRRFAFPNTYQVSFPSTFLTTEAWDCRALSFFIPRHRPMDNVEMSLTAPQEDEFALCTLTFKSPCMSWMFPRQKEAFEKYITFRDVDPEEISDWRNAFEWILKKLTFKLGRPLLLKSPPHTGRVRLLLDMFPKAKFIHIHRDPYTVFQSSRRTFMAMFDWQGLQRPRLDDLNDWILRQYKLMYAAFFEDRKLIPAGSFHEVRFEDLERDPIGQLRCVYQSLNLPDFQEVEPELRRYIHSLAGFRKNTFAELAPELKARIAGEWSQSFNQWQYER